MTADMEDVICKITSTRRSTVELTWDDLYMLLDGILPLSRLNTDDLYALEELLRLRLEDVEHLIATRRDAE